MIGGFIMNKSEIEKLNVIWEKRIADYKQSGLSMKNFCDKHNLNLYQFKYWSQKFRHLNSNPNWVTVNINEDVPRKENQPLYLEIGPCQIKIIPGFDKNLFQELIKALIELC